MKEKQTKIVFRSVIWNLCFYGGCVFCVFYLKNKIEIKNFDVIFVFLPLIFLSFSTECFKIENFKILTCLDFVIKILAYILSQFIFRHIAVGLYFRICIAFFFVCFAFSGISSIIIYCKVVSKNKKGGSKLKPPENR